MSVNVRVVRNDLPGAELRIQRAASQAVRETTFAIESGIKYEMHLPKTGRVYERPTGPHQASAPGEAPAVDTGAYINSVNSTFPSSLTGMVSTNQEQAEALEYGTERTAPRPVWGRVADAEAPRFTPACAGIITRYIARAIASAVHPRVRGDNVLYRSVSLARSGSPPRARG